MSVPHLYLNLRSLKYRDMCQESIIAYPNRVWMPLKTRSRHEKKLRDILAGAGAPHFLPLYTKKTRHRGEKRFVDLPVFPGYLFAALEHNDLLTVYDSRCCAQMLDTPDQDTILRELQNLKRLLDGHSDEKLITLFEIPLGSKVSVVTGPLKGTYGTVIKRKNSDLLVVSVEMLGMSVAVEVDETSLSIDP